MILFGNKKQHATELNRAKLREEMLKGAIDGALRDLRRAREATNPVEDCVRPAVRRLTRALCDVTCV